MSNDIHFKNAPKIQKIYKKTLIIYLVVKWKLRDVVVENFYIYGGYSRNIYVLHIYLALKIKIIFLFLNYIIIKRQLNFVKKHFKLLVYMSFSSSFVQIEEKKKKQ